MSDQIVQIDSDNFFSWMDGLQFKTIPRLTCLGLLVIDIKMHMIRR